MNRSRIHVGLEIGTSKVCAVVGEVKPDGRIKLLGVGSTHSVGVCKGEINDPEKASHCVYDAVRLAEDRSDVEIESVYLSVTGAHISGVNHRGYVVIPDEREEITEEDVLEIKRIAEHVDLPSTSTILHTIIRRFYVDGQEGVEDPVGMIGTQLEADYHVIQGVESRLRNAVRFVKEIPLEVEDIVFGPLAASQILLSREEKRRGALLLDLGGGTTDYLLYDQGSVCQSGSLGLGGDHVNNDIATVLRIPIRLAERLKAEHGHAFWDPRRLGESVRVKDASSVGGLQVDLEELHTVIEMRLREIFEQIRRPLAAAGYLQRVGSGIVLTGGGSLLPGIAPLVQEIFRLPVLKQPPAPVSGALAVAEDPRFSTAIGLIRYAQLQDQVRPTKSVLRRLRYAIGDLLGGRVAL